MRGRAHWGRYGGMVMKKIKRFCWFQDDMQLQNKWGIYTENQPNRFSCQMAIKSNKRVCVNSICNYINSQRVFFRSQSVQCQLHHIHWVQSASPVPGLELDSSSSAAVILAAHTLPSPQQTTTHQSHLRSVRCNIAMHCQSLTTNHKP